MSLTAKKDDKEPLFTTAELENQEFRLNNVYKIINKSGQVVTFRMNWAQKRVFREMWYLNTILKARQLGMSTFIQLFMLDTCLFNSNIKCRVIAHDKTAAKEMFRDKIKFAYDNLHPQLKGVVSARNDSAMELIFSNGSQISVGTSARSGTFQILHVSEFGKICKKYPEKAREIVTGAFEAVEVGQMIFVESTAEGREGRFYEQVQTAKALHDAKATLTKLDFKYHFFPWWKHPSNVLDPTNVLLFQPVQEYFSELEAKHNIKLTMGQKAWYAKKMASLGEDIKREHPSTPEEAFEQIIEGAYYAKEITKARQEKRIGTVAHTEGVAVDTWWDLGFNDQNCIWLTQTIGTNVHVIGYYDNSGEKLAHYVNYLNDLRDEKGYVFGRHVWPHDGGKHDLGTGLTLKEHAARLGMSVEIVPRTKSVQDDIETVRNLFSVCYFDAEACDEGLKGLEAYRKEWDEKKGTWRDKPLHDWASNPADAFRTLAIGIFQQKAKGGSKAKREVKRVDASGWT